MTKNLDEAKTKLWKAGILSWKLHDTQLQIYDSINSSTSSVYVVLSSRQIGKCRAKTDTCLTPNGPVQMQHIKKGDKVYGYNSDGTISLCNVLDSWSTGEKEVVDLIHNNRVLETCTKDHRWLTTNLGIKQFKKVRKVQDFYKGVAINRSFIDIPCGTVNEPHAYALGALLGDGCSKQGTNKINISSENDIIPNRIASILNAQYVYKNSKNNFTWVISHEEKKTVGSSSYYNQSVHCNYYDQWCRDKYAHEKIADWDVINTWNRESCLNFLAGLLDTDGNIIVVNNILTIQLGMQAKPVIDIVEKLIYKLWQYKASRTVDKRKKYKNGPVYNVKISQNLFSKRALKELSPYLSLERKKWKPEYENCLENNSNKEKVGVKLSKPYKAECWEITVDSDTNMYLTGNGLITHNSFLLCTYVIEYAMKHAGVKICYLAPQAKMVKKIIVPRIKEILKDCPKDLKPTYKVNDQVYIFPNGSEIHIAGTDAGRAENLRGQVFHLAVCDEAGFIDDLSYLISSILIPTISTTQGRIILSSTPPISPDHAFVKYCRQAELEGNLIKKTIYDNPLIDAKYIDELKKACGGEESDAWRREYLAEFITSTKDAVIPEATVALMEELVKEHPRPLFYDSYTSLDLGYIDNTGLLLGYWDFMNAKLVIEDEAAFNKPTSTQIAEIVKQKEKELWEINGTVKEPYKRIIDGNDITIADLNAPPNNLRFVKTRNDDLLAAVNETRVMIYNKQIIIHPRCKHLISELKYAVWDSSGRKFARSDEESRGHFDVLMALIYMVRNLNKQKNPYPPGLGLDVGMMYVHPDMFKNKSSNAEVIKKALLGDFYKKFKKD